MLDENAIEQFEKELSELSRDAMERSNCKDGSAREGLEKLAKIVFSHLRERTPTPLEPSCGENSTISGIRDILDMQGVTTEARLRIIAKFIRALQS